MAADKYANRQLERLMDVLGDSVLDLSDEELIAEVHETGDDPEQEARRTRALLQGVCDMYEQVTRRLSDLGHVVDAGAWRLQGQACHNNCQICGSPLSFTVSTGAISGGPFIETCHKLSRGQKREATG